MVRREAERCGGEEGLSVGAAENMKSSQGDPSQEFIAYVYGTAADVSHVQKNHQKCNKRPSHKLSFGLCYLHKAGAAN